MKCNLKASVCINYPFKIKCLCEYGYSGDGVNYCDECGLAYEAPNLKIVGGVDAVAYSWPATAVVSFSYKTRISINGRMQEYEYGSQCGGALIDRDTILTAAHCIITEFTVSGFNERDYTYSVKPNEFYPTYAVYIYDLNLRLNAKEIFN
jgi:hypothetical protein